jgi:hypothetical protein
MFVVRYVALAALVVWLGGAVVLLADMLIGGVSSRFQLVAAAGGAVIFICLFIMKFIGPPPRAFTVRAGLAFTVMLIGLRLSMLQRPSPALVAVEAALGLLLLAWYARE